MSSQEHRKLHFSRTMHQTAPLRHSLSAIIASLYKYALLEKFESTSKQNPEKKGLRVWQGITELLKYIVLHPSYLSPFYVIEMAVYSLFTMSNRNGKDLLPEDYRKTFTTLPYKIKESFKTPVTEIFFTRSKRTMQQICLKKWPRSTDILLVDEARRAENLIEGLVFNRKVARGVYLGIASLLILNDKRQIIRGPLIREPREQDLEDLKGEANYAIVMKRLKDSQRLDLYLQQAQEMKARNRRDFLQKCMQFLASQVATMHKTLAKSTHEMGKPEHLASKLDMNIHLFEETLNWLEVSKKSGWEQAGTNYELLEKCKEIAQQMKEACSACSLDFKDRYKHGHVMRCHGDLKTVNLWVQPTFPLSPHNFSRSLLALDCIDFNPLLCHIDTLSDVAMLAIDLETRLKKDLTGIQATAGEKELVEVFLNKYLEEMKESRAKVKVLLEYYMTEKAMACAHAFFLYYEEPEIGEVYLEVALRHAQELQELLKSHGEQESMESCTANADKARSCDGICIAAD